MQRGEEILSEILSRLPEETISEKSIFLLSKDPENVYLDFFPDFEEYDPFTTRYVHSSDFITLFQCETVAQPEISYVFHLLIDRYLGRKCKFLIRRDRYMILPKELV